MSNPLAEGKTSPELEAAVDHLRREFDKLQQLREAVAEAERLNLDREQHPRARPLS